MHRHGWVAASTMAWLGASPRSLEHRVAGDVTRATLGDLALDGHVDALGPGASKQRGDRVHHIGKLAAVDRRKGVGLAPDARGIDAPEGAENDVDEVVAHGVERESAAGNRQGQCPCQPKADRGGCSPRSSFQTCLPLVRDAGGLRRGRTGHIRGRRDRIWMQAGTRGLNEPARQRSRTRRRVRQSRAPEERRLERETGSFPTLVLTRSGSRGWKSSQLLRAPPARVPRVAATVWHCTNPDDAVKRRCNCKLARQQPDVANVLAAQGLCHSSRQRLRGLCALSRSVMKLLRLRPERVRRGILM